MVSFLANVISNWLKMAPNLSWAENMKKEYRIFMNSLSTSMNIPDAAVTLIKSVLIEPYRYYMHEMKQYVLPTGN